MWENIIFPFIFGGSSGALVLWLGKAVLSERIKNAIKHEYDVKLEQQKSLLKSEFDKQFAIFKSEIRSHEIIEQARWEIKRKACLKAMDIVDAYFANIEWSGKDSKGKSFDTSDIEKQSPPKIEDIRSCYNSLALSCDNEDVLREYKRCLNLFGNIQADVIIDLRNAVRKELGFGSEIDFDRTSAFIGRINKPSS